MRKVYKSYRELLGILWASSPFIIILTLIVSVASGLMTPLGV